MKKIILFAATLILAIHSSSAQGFVNLNFENANLSNDAPPFGFLPWSEAVPGWNHGDGASTDTVYHGNVHVGISPWYLLVDGQSTIDDWLGFTSLDGRFAIAMKNGNASSLDPQSPWVNSFLSQNGMIPIGTQSLTLFASGSLGIQWNGNSLDVVALGGNLYGADVSALAGTTGELKVVNLGTDQLDILTIDNIQFSSSVVPEPTTIAMIACGAFVFVAVRRNGRKATPF